MRIAGFIALVLAAWLPLAAVAAAPAPAAASPPKPPPAMVLDNVGAELADGSTYQVHILGLHENVAAGFDSGTLTLRLNGNELPTLGKVVDRQADTVTFTIKRQPADQTKWQSLAGSPPLNGRRTVLVGVGRSGRPDFDYAGQSAPTTVLRLFDPASWLLAGGLELATIALVVVLAMRTGMLRNPSALPVAQRQFSMSRCQLAFWFVLITGAFLFIWGLTGQYNGIITPQSLTLLGISGLTSLGAVAVDAVKGDPAPPPAPGVAAPPAPPVPTHSNFFADILTDSSGVVLHRLQILVWTLILGAISIRAVYSSLSLPPLDENLLILMGISSGLYVGFKFPEQQTA